MRGIGGPARWCLLRCVSESRRVRSREPDHSSLRYHRHCRLKTSRSVIPCLVVTSVTAAAGSVSIVESILRIISLLSLPVGTDESVFVEAAMSRTAAMIVVFSRAMRATRRPRPIPLLASVMR